MNNEIKSVDFADFHIEGVYNRNTAKELSMLLNAYTDIDELVGMYEHTELKYKSTVGTGNSGIYFPVATLSQQRSMLANHFARFALRHYNHCHLGLYEYECLRELYIHIDENYAINDAEDQLKLLNKVLTEFEREYSQVDKTFVFTLLSR